MSLASRACGSSASQVASSSRVMVVSGGNRVGQLPRLARDLAAVDVAQHRNVAEREGIAAGMAAFLLHQHARLRVPAALIHQPQHISARLPARMRDKRGNTTPRDRDRVRVDATQLGEPPVLHLDDEYADLRKYRDQIRIAPPHHRLVIDEAIVRKPCQRRETRRLGARGARCQRSLRLRWVRAGHRKSRPMAYPGRSCRTRATRRGPAVHAGLSGSRARSRKTPGSARGRYGSAGRRTGWPAA